MKPLVAQDFARRRKRASKPSVYLARGVFASVGCLVLLAALVPAKAEAAECSEARPENFGSFLSQFSTNTQFAAARTVLPLLTQRWANDDDWFDDPVEPAQVWVSRDSYVRRPSLRSQSSARHQALQIKSLTPTAATVELGDHLSASTQAFHFNLEQGCWRLWKVEEFGE